MNELRGNNQSVADLNEAGELRRRAEELEGRAELLESRARVRARLEQILLLSTDPAYTRYVEQMRRDLDSGKATPAQVEREAQRSYNRYCQRQQIDGAKKGFTGGSPRPAAVLPVCVSGDVREDGNTSQKRNVEFRIGVQVFSVTGAVFVLAAFVIFGFHFMSGLAQGLCLYGLALAVLILSEFVLAKRAPAFSYIITGIGIGGFYAANFVNYLVSHVINGIVAMAVTLLAAAFALLISRKRHSALIKAISLIGCYICFLPLRGIDNELEILAATVMLFIVNILNLLIQGQGPQGAARRDGSKEEDGKQALSGSSEKNAADAHLAAWEVVDAVHLLLSTAFAVAITGMAWKEGIDPVYAVPCVVSSFLFVEIFSLKRCMEESFLLFPLCCIVSGIHIFLLFLLGDFGSGADTAPERALFVRIVAQALLTPICGVVYMLWDKKDGRRWSQLYYAVCIVLFLGSFSAYRFEVVLSVLAALFVTKLAAGQREVAALDCLVVFWAGVVGLCQWGHCWLCCWLIAGAMLLSALGIKRLHIYHEVAITVSILATWWLWCCFYLYKEYDLLEGLLYPVSAGVLLFLFLLFNHLPWLKIKKQLSYNVTNVIFMVLYYLAAWSCDDLVVSAAMMVLGAVTILTVFRERYGMAIPRKYLVLAVFLTWSVLTGHYRSPIVVSILLMAIALMCVGIGFKLSDKTERVYGLVTAAFVCLKLVIYDFKEVGTVYRIAVFLTVGLVALIISFLYIQLEKAERQRAGQK